MKKITTIILSAVLAVSMIADVSAWSFSAVNTKFGTKGTLDVSGNWSVDIPLIGTCIMNVNGTSKLTFDPVDTDYKSKLTKHVIDVEASGIFGSLSVNGGGLDVAFNSDNTVATIKSGGTRDWDYHIITSCGRMTKYIQTHKVSYKLRRDNKNKASVSMGGYWKWGF